eukprot:Em0240g4a
MYVTMIIAYSMTSRTELHLLGLDGVETPVAMSTAGMPMAPGQGRTSILIANAAIEWVAHKQNTTEVMLEDMVLCNANIHVGNLVASSPSPILILKLSMEHSDLDTHLMLSYLLALPQVAAADQLFSKMAVSKVSLQLAIYYACLQIYARTADSSNGEPLLCPPVY